MRHRCTFIFSERQWESNKSGLISNNCFLRLSTVDHWSVFGLFYQYCKSDSNIKVVLDKIFETASFSTYPIHNDHRTREKGDHCHYYHVIMDTYIYHSKDRYYVNHLLKHFYNIRRRSMTVHVKLSYATHQLNFFNTVNRITDLYMLFYWQISGKVEINFLNELIYHDSGYDKSNRCKKQKQNQNNPLNISLWNNFNIYRKSTLN